MEQMQSTTLATILMHIFILAREVGILHIHFSMDDYLAHFPEHGVDINDLPAVHQARMDMLGARMTTIPDLPPANANQAAMSNYKIRHAEAMRQTAAVKTVVDAIKKTMNTDQLSLMAQARRVAIIYALKDMQMIQSKVLN